jgi:F0F1-type ATP synthase assembly protein I
MALGFALPIVAGALIDQWLRSSPIGVLVGLVLGFIAGMTQILRVARTGTGGGNSPRDSS